MSFATTFNHAHAVLPVIHVTDPHQAVRNASLAVTCGADGVFLIDHQQSAATLLECYAAVRAAVPDLWVGINILGLHAADAFAQAPRGATGLWVDQAGIDETAEIQLEATAAAQIRAEVNFTGLYFGGVAFKYQRPVSDIPAACRAAIEFVDVVTTSGYATGHAAAVAHVEEMRAALGDHPLALASGITPENVEDYMPSVDAFLVATGISRDFHELDPYLTAKLVDTVRASP